MKVLKNLFYTSLVSLFLLMIVSPVSAHPADDRFVLVLDAGHGGKDPGACGKKGKEKNINLAVTKLVGKYISEQHSDVKVVYTRERDVFVELDDRADIANKAKANLFISIHTNWASTAAARGSEVYTFGITRNKENLDVAKRENSVIYLEDNYQERYEGYDPNSPESLIIFEFMQGEFAKHSIDFANVVQKELRNCVGWKSRGAKQAGYLVLRKSTMPRILVELDFISNPTAEAFLLSEAGQKKYAKAICAAFTNYKTEYDRKTVNPQTSQTSQTSQMSQTSPKKAVIDSYEPETVIDRPEVAENQVKATTPKGKTVSKGKTVYKVQILAHPKKLPKNARQLKGYDADYYIDKGLYKYTYGRSTDWDEISRIRKSVSKDFKDAFIVTFVDGVRVN
ncbi:MAG: N-acetylmuramoyl-L-alanine amidase [Candidatus Symbiothrix sp.]|jgi:N-acetylmuramoyl-L-alanine amidase|nr:N-acetylmuramoyl-L-alanine amidase [Candidatus Symbiothrix sp.]